MMQDWMMNCLVRERIDLDRGECIVFLGFSGNIEVVVCGFSRYNIVYNFSRYNIVCR